MAVLCDTGIIEAQKKGQITISDFSTGSDHLQPASYDLRLGKLLIPSKGVEGESVILQTGEWAAVMSHEKISLGNRVCALIGLRSAFARRGLLYFGGPQIDPGYSGRIFGSVFNASSSAVPLCVGDLFFTLTFLNLESPCVKLYDGPHQHREQFTDEEVTEIYGQVQQFFATLEKVRSLENNLESQTKAVSKLQTDLESSKRRFKDVLVIFIIPIGFLALVVAVTLVAAVFPNLIKMFQYLF